MASEKSALDAEKMRLTNDIKFQQESHTKEKEQLQKTIESLRQSPAPALEIEGIPLDIQTGAKPMCQVRIYNKSIIKVENVQVEVSMLEDDFENETQKAYYRPKYPLTLLPEIAGVNSINPGQKLTFNLFKIVMVEGRAKSEDAISMGNSRYGPITIVNDTLPQDRQKESVPYRTFIAYFTADTSKNLVRFFWKRPYRIKLLASSHLGSVEREFYLAFFDEGKSCHFRLRRINSDMTNNEKAKEAVEKLTGFATMFLQRVNAIKATQPSKYDPQKDDELWKANDAAIAYIVLNLNQDAAKVYDDGVAEINAYSLRPPGIGSTRYEDDHRVVLARFSRRLLNLKRIIEDIGNYLNSTDDAVV